MHKIFAKTVFLGKNTEYLPICHSTNDIAKERYRNGVRSNGYVWYTDYQTSGKGQIGNSWESRKGENLLFTTLLIPDELKPTRQYLINVMAALAVAKTTSDYFPMGKVEIKWPNDVYLNDRKIAGILVETFISGQEVEAVFCGIGFNVNQETFNFPTATSLRAETQNDFDRTAVMETFLLNLEFFHTRLADGDWLVDQYLHQLRWRDERRIFSKNDKEFEGVIKGITGEGKLAIETKSGLETFNVKEIAFIR